MKARGRTKKILLKVGQIQGLIGEAKTFHGNDRDNFGFERGQKKLEEALNICYEITAMYEPLNEWKGAR